MALERMIRDGATAVTSVPTSPSGGSTVWRMPTSQIPRLELLVVGGRTAERDHVATVNEHELTQSAARANRTLLARASTVTSKEGTSP